MLDCTPRQRISKEELVKLISEKVLKCAEFELDKDGNILLHAGIVGDCDIEIEIKVIDAARFYPGG